MAEAGLARGLVPAACQGRAVCAAVCVRATMHFQTSKSPYSIDAAFPAVAPWHSVLPARLV